jgi:hypothetical protein
MTTCREHHPDDHLGDVRDRYPRRRRALFSSELQLQLARHTRRRTEVPT